MEKNNKPVDWGDINQFQNEIDIQAEWLTLRKKLERKKKNRKLFLLFLSAASSFLLFIFLNGRTDQIYLKTTNNKMNLDTSQTENNMEVKSQLAEVQIGTINSSCYKESKSHNYITKKHHSKEFNNLTSGTTPHQFNPNSSTIKQSIPNLTIELTNLQSHPKSTINQYSNSTINQSNHLTMEEPLLFIPMVPIMSMYPASELSKYQHITFPEIINHKVIPCQKLTPISNMGFVMSAGLFSMIFTTDNKELNSYTLKLNSIEKPLYEIGIASNLEFKLNNRISFIGELNYRRQTSRVNQKETIQYSEEKDNVLLEINRRPDGSEEQIRGKAIVEVNKTLLTNYYNNYQTVGLSGFLKYRLKNWKTSHFDLASGINLGSFSWNDGYMPDHDNPSEFIPIKDYNNGFNLFDNWMLRAIYSFDISSTMEIGMYCQYSNGIKSRPIDDDINLNTSSLLFGIVVKTHL
jgi:hypothetical protein